MTTQSDLQREPAAALPGEPPRELRFHRKVGAVQSVRDIWRAREMIRSLVERSHRARYKQALLGSSWALFTPLALIVVFSLFVRRVASIDTGGVPYPVFAALGVLPWTFFSSAMSKSATSLLGNSALLNKVICPREVFPLSNVVVAAIEAVMATVALLVLFAVEGFAPRGTSVWVPLLILVEIVFIMGVAFTLAIIVVYLRDLQHALALFLQLGLFATPVAYGLDLVPERFLHLYSFLNPLAPVIDGLRRSVLYGMRPQWDLLALGTGGALCAFVLGLWLFKRLEVGIADVA